MDEHLFIPLWLAGIFLIISDLNNPKIWKIIVAGLICGVAAHIRTYAFAMGLVVFLLWILTRKNFRAAFLRGLLMQVLIISLAVPWAIRNYHVFGKPVFYTTIVGMMLYYGNNPNLDPINPPLNEKGGDSRYLEARNEAFQNEGGKKAAYEWITAHPREFLDRAVSRLFYNLGLDSEQWIITDNFNTIAPGHSPPSETSKKIFAQLDHNYYVVIFLLALLGLLIFLLNDKNNISRGGVWCLMLTLGYYLGMIALTVGHRKYRFVIEPLFCLIAAYGLYLLIWPQVKKN